jgi:bifunctional non-homologous end joining protein LigD
VGLDTYKAKRDFETTAEPAGKVGVSDPTSLSYVIQQHAASRLHYDFRLELDGVLLSWAVPKGPNLDPGEKRLAMQVEDHPLEYGGFEGTIPKGEYGGGTVMLWDRGRWEPEGDPHAGLKKGHLRFTLHGERLRGGWHLVRTSSGGKNAWLLIKSKDDEARPGKGAEAIEAFTTSVDSDRDMDTIAKDEDRVWTREGERPGADALRDEPGAVVRELSWPLKPQLATLASRPPGGGGWVHEIKLDGYRVLLRLEDGKASIWTRSGLDWTDRLRPVAAAVEALSVRDAVMDGELVALDAKGRTSFSALQKAMGSGGNGLHVYVFDLLAKDGVDLRELPLLRRKELLRGVVPTGKGRIRYSDHLDQPGDVVLEQACSLGAEGIVSKRADAPYRSTRTRDWIKVKCLGREDFVIGGFVTRAGGVLSSLLLGQERDGELVYAGRVGTGFSDADRKALRKKLDPLVTEEPSLPGAPRAPRADTIHWVEPRLRAEVAFTEMTRDGIVRHPSFKGLREDLEEPEAATVDVRLTNPDKVLYPEIGLTKRQLAEWAVRMAPWILPHVALRPLTLYRCPNGHAKPCFFQKHHENVPDSVFPVTVPDEEEPYVMIRDAEGLVGLVQLGVLEIHPWGSRADRPERPDRMIIDFDPDSSLPFSVAVEGAIEVRDRLDALGLKSWVRTTGGKGLHVVVPLVRRHTWDEVKDFSRRVAEDLVRADPKRYIATSSKAKRKGKVYVDWLRNGMGATAVASWSWRARPGAPVAVPLRWADLDPKMDPSEYTVPTLSPPRSDPWKGFFDSSQSLTAAMLEQLGAR